MAEKLLDGPNVVIRLQKMSGKTVAEGVGGDALGKLGPPDRCIKGFLDMRFMKMIPSELFCARNRCKRLLRKKPLPDKIIPEILIQRHSHLPTDASADAVPAQQMKRFLAEWEQEQAASVLNRSLLRI